MSALARNRRQRKVMKTSMDEQTTYADMDNGWAWVVMAADFFTIFICGGLLQTSGIVHASLMEKYEEGVAKTAWVSSTFTAMLSLVGPIGSFVIDKTNCRTAVIVGGLLMAAGCLITAFAPNIDVCLFGYGLLSGFGGGVVYTAIFSVNGFNFKKRLNLAQGVAITGAGCGLFVMSPLMEASYKEYGYTGFFLILSGICLQVVLCGALMRPSQLEIDLKRIRQRKHTGDRSKKHNTTFNIYMNVITNKFALLMSFSMLTYFGGLYTIFLHWPNFCLVKGFTSMEASYVLSLIGILSVCGRACTGLVAVLNIVDERLLYTGSFAIISIPMIVFQFYSSFYYGHIVNAVIFGLLNGACFVVLTTINAKHIGIEYLSASVGMEFWVGGVGSIVFPVLTGYMLNGGWTYEHVFLASGICILIAALTGLSTLFIKRDEHGLHLNNEQTREIIIPEAMAILDSCNGTTKCEVGDRDQETVT